MEELSFQDLLRIVEVEKCKQRHYKLFEKQSDIYIKNLDSPNKTMHFDDDGNLLY